MPNYLPAQTREEPVMLLKAKAVRDVGIPRSRM
jgi:hypothetical protein